MRIVFSIEETHNQNRQQLSQLKEVVYVDSPYLTAKLMLLELTSMYECPRPFGSSLI